MKTNFDSVKFISQRNDNHNYGIYLFNLKLILKTTKPISSAYLFTKSNGRRQVVIKKNAIKPSKIL